jgi:hypothetical protein
MVRYSATLRNAAQTFDANHHLKSLGLATFTREDQGLVVSGYAIYQIGAEWVDQIYDCAVAIDCKVFREVCGSSWAPEKVLFSRARPADVGPYRRFFQAPCRFDSERTAMLFPSSVLERPMPEADPKTAEEP